MANTMLINNTVLILKVLNVRFCEFIIYNAHFNRMYFYTVLRRIPKPKRTSKQPEIVSIIIMQILLAVQRAQS